MDSYKQIMYKAGMTVEVIKCIPREGRKGEHRERIEKTPEEMRQANMRQAARKLARKINANFHPGDWHIVLTYRKEARCEPGEAQQNIRKFLQEMRKEYAKSGFEFKYVQTTEYKNKAIHHHLIVNNINDGVRTTTDIVRKLWRGKGNPKFTALYDTGEYSQLADYFIKETEKTFREASSPVKQRYSCSRNLVTPKPEIQTRKAKTWRREPKPLKGYYILRDSLYNGTDKLGYRYQRYIMVRLDPGDGDWWGAAWPPAGDGKT